VRSKADETGRTITDNARREAEGILANARAEAGRLVAEAELKVSQLEDRRRDIKQEMTKLREAVARLTGRSAELFADEEAETAPQAETAAKAEAAPKPDVAPKSDVAQKAAASFSERRANPATGIAHVPERSSLPALDADDDKAEGVESAPKPEAAVAFSAAEPASTAEPAKSDPDAAAEPKPASQPKPDAEPAVAAKADDTPRDGAGSKENAAAKDEPATDERTMLMPKARADVRADERGNDKTQLVATTGGDRPAPNPRPSDSTANGSDVTLTDENALSTGDVEPADRTMKLSDLASAEAANAAKEKGTEEASDEDAPAAQPKPSPGRPSSGPRPGSGGRPGTKPARSGPPGGSPRKR